MKLKIKFGMGLKNNLTTTLAKIGKPNIFRKNSRKILKLP